MRDVLDLGPKKVKPTNAAYKTKRVSRAADETPQAGRAGCNVYVGGASIERMSSESNSRHRVSNHEQRIIPVYTLDECSWR